MIVPHCIVCFPSSLLLIDDDVVVPATESAPTFQFLILFLGIVIIVRWNALTQD